jgi:hypothetical protein
MKIPVIRGLIRRRLLINYRVDAKVMEHFLPKPFRPKLHQGYAIAGICLIRLEGIRPQWLPFDFGISSENAAHRIAVLWDEPSGKVRDGVFIPRRDTSSWLNHLAGGRVFPGEHHLSAFDVTDSEAKINMTISSRDKTMSIKLQAGASDDFPASSCFASLSESSAFFESGSVGYSVIHNSCCLDGIELKTAEWKVRPLQIAHLESSFFSESSVFPAGSVTFDHALIMRNVSHEWHEAPEMRTL